MLNKFSDYINTKIKNKIEMHSTYFSDFFYVYDKIFGLDVVEMFARCS